MNRPPLNSNRRRRGFTLVELLVVVVIIATLIALLIPAIAAAVRAARNASVQAEINTLVQALTDFKSKYGDVPPSRIILNEAGILPTGVYQPTPSGAFDPSGSTPTDITLSQLANRTQNAMRKFWPRAVFPVSGNYWYDFNGNGLNDGPTKFSILQGHECLVFFLGGIPLSANGQLSVIGFGKDPVNPFSNGIVGNAMYNANRNPPFYTFDTSRLVITNPSDGALVPLAEYPSGYNRSYAPGYIDSATGLQIGNPGYLDSLGVQGSQSFYAYFSTNNGSGYDPNDVNLQSAVDVDNTGTTHLSLQFCAPLTVPAQTAPQRTFSPVPNPYTTSSTVPSTSTSQSPTYINAQSFQIISPGADGAYGSGGFYAATSTGSAPELSAAQNSLSNSNDAGIRVLEWDNLTNFHNGKLQ